MANTEKTRELLMGALSKMTGYGHSSAFGACTYRNPPCVVGMLIDDRFYDPNMEGSQVSDYRVWSALKQSYPDIELDRDLLDTAQELHDSLSSRVPFPVFQARAQEEIEYQARGKLEFELQKQKDT